MVRPAPALLATKRHGITQTRYGSFHPKRACCSRLGLAGEARHSATGQNRRGSASFQVVQVHGPTMRFSSRALARLFVARFRNAGLPRLFATRLSGTGNGLVFFVEFRGSTGLRFWPRRHLRVEVIIAPAPPRANLSETASPGRSISEFDTILPAVSCTRL